MNPRAFLWPKTVRSMSVVKIVFRSILVVTPCRLALSTAHIVSSFRSTAGIWSGLQSRGTLSCQHKNICGLVNNFSSQFTRCNSPEFSRSEIEQDSPQNKKMIPPTSIVRADRSGFGVSFSPQSRLRRLYSKQEFLLEFSLVLIVLGCFLLLSISSKFIKQLSAENANFVAIQ